MEHLVSHAFRCVDLFHFFSLFLLLFFHLVLGLCEDLLVKVLLLSLHLLFELSLLPHLLIENIFDLLNFNFVIFFYLSLSLFVQLLTVSLNFTPFVIRNV